MSLFNIVWIIFEPESFCCPPFSPSVKDVNANKEENENRFEKYHYHHPYIVALRHCFMN